MWRTVLSGFCAPLSEGHGKLVLHIMDVNDEELLGQYGELINMILLWESLVGVLASVLAPATIASGHPSLTTRLRDLDITRPTRWWGMRRFHGRCAATYPPSESVADELRVHGVPNPNFSR